ncbi:MAG: hypothetical protein P9F75_07270 [Candidatus Contendobacter sp.]|nr:hypothetical protein [Candidatus Contendobacter sp.]
MTASSVKQRLFPGGKVFFDAFDANNALTGERYLGLTPGFTVTIASETIQSYSSESGLKELDDETLITITRTGKITCRQISIENLGLFLGAAASTVAQASGAVTGEHKSVLLDRYYQLGASTNNPSGVREVTSPTVVGKTASNWAATTAYAVGDRVKKVSTPTHIHVCTVAGTSAGSEPTWPTTIDATVTDGTVTWRTETLITLVADTDYTVDLDLGRVYVLPAARLSAYGGQWTFGYTKSAVSREVIETGGVASSSGALRFVASPAKGTPRDLYAPNVTLAPSGDWILKADDPAHVEIAWDVTFNVGINGEPALIIDGRAA